MTIDSDSAGNFDGDGTIRSEVDSKTLPLRGAVNVEHFVENPFVDVSEPSPEIKAFDDAGKKVVQSLDTVVADAESWKNCAEAWQKEAHAFNLRLQKTTIKTKSGFKEMGAVIRDLKTKYATLVESDSATQDELALVWNDLERRNKDYDALEKTLKDAVDKHAVSEADSKKLKDFLAVKTSEYASVKNECDLYVLAKDAMLDYLLKVRPEFVARLFDHGPETSDEELEQKSLLFRDPSRFYEAIACLLDEDAQERELLQARAEQLEDSVKRHTADYAKLQKDYAAKTAELDAIKAQVAVDEAYIVEQTGFLLSENEKALKRLDELKRDVHGTRQ
ncbi:hypothetical protein HY484_03785 [Candidatus Woesearchaeota archaeon]|nr:hypothetical protein [Candidatus Woesearchaeota archaeon]